jgi:hypothetical protein
MRRSICFVLIATALLTACGTGTQPAAPLPASPVTPAASASALVEQIAQAEQRWAQQQIASYSITVIQVNSLWHAQTQTITVTDGVVTGQAAFCTPAPLEGRTCEVAAFDATEYTVPGLFATARSYAARGGGQQLAVSFDPTYGYPARMRVDDPEAIDDDIGWAVESFAVVPAATPLEAPELIVTASYTAVVFPASRGPEFSGWMSKPPQGYWTPTRAEMARLEQGLAAYLRQAAPPHAGDLVERLSGASGQFIGVVSAGRRVVFGSFFCRAPEGIDLQSGPVFVADGGACYFQLSYDVEADRFYDLRVNGEA